MGVNKVAFQSAGKRTEHLIPGVNTRINYVDGNGGGVSSSVGVIIGPSKGGEPKKLLAFSTESEARATLLDGALLEGVLHAFNPGGDLIPQAIYAMRVNEGVQAQSAFMESTNDMIVVKAWDWGLHTNQLKRKLEAGTAAGSHKLTIQLGGEEAEVIDNISRPSFSIQYTGAGAAATVSISKTGLSTLVDATPGLSIDFGSFETIEDIVNYVNDQEDYQAVLLTGDGTESAFELDTVVGQSIKTVFTAKSDLQAIIDALRSSFYVASADHPDAAESRFVPDYDSALVYFTGGASGTTDATAYLNALTALENEQVNAIVPVSTDAAVHLLVKNHCAAMSATTGRKERMAWVGGAYGETVDAVISRAKALNSELVNIAYPGFSQYNILDVSKGIKTYSPAFYACKLLGQEMALAVNEPVTNKPVDILSWNKTLSRSEIEKLIQGGVTVGAKNDNGGLVTIRAITTFQGSILQKNERSMVREAQYMARDFRLAYSGDIGRPQTAVGLGTVESLLAAKGVEWYNLGLIVKAASKPLLWGITLRETADAVLVEYHAYLTAPRNFVFGTANLHVLTQVVSV